MSGIRWRSRGSHGRLLHRTIKRLEQRFENEKDHDRCISLAKTIGYLVSVQRELIKDEEHSSLEKRVEELEKKADL